MIDVELDARQFQHFIRKAQTLYGERETNRWIAASFRKDTSQPLKRALKGVTPRSGRSKRRWPPLYQSVSHILRNRQVPGIGYVPTLFVGGRKNRGGFIYYFLRGTKPRYTKKGAYRGRIYNQLLGPKALHIGGQATFRRFARKFIAHLDGAVRRISRGKPQARR